ESLRGVGLERLDQPFVVGQRPTGVIRPCNVQECLQLACRLQGLLQRSLREVVVPVEARADREIGPEQRRIGGQAVQGKLAPGGSGGSARETCRWDKPLRRRG